MNCEEYFPVNYTQDLAYFKSLNVGDHLCGRILGSLFNSKERLEFVNLEHFLICQYQLNLISQVLHSAFPLEQQKFMSSLPEYIDCRCTYNKHPVHILTLSEKESKGTINKLSFSAENILHWDEYFSSLYKKLLTENDIGGLNWEDIETAIKKDPDCNSKEVRDYFLKKLRT